jgi:cellulose synthase/poly-beta-1,6-N-acetylglucosamine synthase-like glycosyltransferase
MTREQFAFDVMAAGTTYFVLWAITQLGMGLQAAASMWRYQRRQSRRARALVERVSPPFVSIVVPAHNEELTIVESVRALLAMDYEARELVVVNDGSSDETLALLQRTFQLIAAPVAYAQPLATAPVRGIYRSAIEPALVVVDKENGGCKADASNAGINAASGELVLVIDADTILEPDALTRAVLPFLEDPRTVAVGAKVTIVNGCTIEHGRVTSVALPDSWLARYQIVEYMRAFLLFRVACAASNSLLILSGAFGLFRRDSVITVGGYDREAIGEDMDLTMRLHRHYRAKREPFRVGFDPAPLCCTQAPEDFASLRSQRYRWRRGLLQVIWRHRGMIGNPRYGLAGLGAFPYMIVFEGMAPLLEFASYVLAAIALVIGGFDWRQYAIVILIWTLLGTSVSMAAVLLNDVATRRYMRGRDLVMLVVVALTENFWYRQLNNWWGVVGTVQALTGKGGWGTMKRQALGSVSADRGASPS